MRISDWSSDVCSSDLLLALLPVRNGPDVLRVRRGAPRQAGHQRRVTGHRGRRMKEVGVDLLDSAGQLGRQHAGLSAAAQTVGRQVAPEVAQEGTPGTRVAGASGKAPRGERARTAV